MARTEGKRSQPKKRAPSKGATRPAAPLPTAEDRPSGLGKKIVIAGGVLVAVAAVVVFGITLAGEEERGVVESAALSPDVVMTGSNLPTFTAAEGDQALGMVAPEASSGDFAGAPASIEHDGIPKMVLFLAHWCDHCRAEVPAVQAWINQNGVPDGVDFVSVATSINEIRPNYPPDAWLEREGWTQRVVVDDPANRIATGFGLNAFPFYVLLDGEGRVLQRLAGAQSPEFVGLMLDSLAQSG